MISHSSLFKACLLFCLLFSACGSDEATESGRSPLILISIDGLKPDLPDSTSTPTLDMLAAQGTLAEAMIPVFPTSTFPNHYSLVTGLYTENTGVIANSMYDPEMERYFSLGNRAAVEDGRWYGGEPIWVTAERQDVRTATMFWPGSEAEIAGMRPTRSYTYDGSLPYEARIDSVMHWLTLPDTDATRPDFITLYFSTVDSRGHSDGTYAEATKDALTMVDGHLGTLVERLQQEGLWENINMLITSDHGMQNLSEERLIFLDDLIDLDEVNIYNWSPVAMIQPKEKEQTQAIYDALKAGGEQDYTVYMKDDVPERWRFAGHPRVPEIVMVADLGWTLSSRSFYERRGLLAATHGFDNAHEEMHTYFLAVGKDIEEGRIIPAFETVHVYELMARLLNIDPAPNDGDPDVLNNIRK